MKKIILGSRSPRRRELLEQLGIAFSVDTDNHFEEKSDSKNEAHQIPLDMCRGKSHGFHRALADDELLITADTVVIVDGVVLGKPRSREEAAEMLSLLSGRTHEVVTAVCLRDAYRESCFSDSTWVRFEELSPTEIDYYITHYHPFDKAGAYGVQEWIGYVAVSRIEGSFYNVMGLPMHKVYQELKKFALLTT